MKQYLFFYTIIILLLCACGEEKPKGETNYTYTCIAVNMGNYMESNGSITLYDEPSGKVYQEVYTQANGRKLAAIIESAVLHEGKVLLMCNSADKIVLLDAVTMRELCEPITAVGIPRYAACNGNYAYISCWETTNVQTGAVSVPHQIIKINLETKKIEKRLSPSAQPEALLWLDNRLFAAVGNGLDVFDTQTDMFVQHIPSGFAQAEAQELLHGSDNRLWLSVGSQAGSGGLLCIDAATLEVLAEFTVPRLAFEGNIALSPDRNRLYFLTAEGIVGGQEVETPTAICSINANNFDEFLPTAVVRGNGFYGFDVNPFNGNIYTANVNGFITNSMMYRYSSEGNKLSDTMTGVGTCRFIFK